jgi:intracellular septation protein A
MYYIHDDRILTLINEKVKLSIDHSIHAVVAIVLLILGTGVACFDLYQKLGWSVMIISIIGAICFLIASWKADRDVSRLIKIHNVKIPKQVFFNQHLNR